MASPGWPYYSRFCSVPDMFSFSLDPEIVSFLWTTSPQRIDVDPASRYQIPHPSQLFHIFLSSENEDATFLSTLQYSVVTTGILVVVGASSYCTFKLLQCIRQGLAVPLVQSLKNLFAHVTKPFALHWRKVRRDEFSEIMLPHANLNGKQLSKRPSELRLVVNGSPRGHRGYYSSRDTSLERRLLLRDPTPLADCEMASGEEEIGDTQGQYFGPNVESKKICMDLLGSSPEDSPSHALSPRKARRSPKKGKFRESESYC